MQHRVSVFQQYIPHTNTTIQASVTNTLSSYGDKINDATVGNNYENNYSYGTLILFLK